MVTFADLGKSIFVCRQTGRRSAVPIGGIPVVFALSTVAGLLIALTFQAGLSRKNTAFIFPVLCGLVMVPTASRKSLLESRNEEEQLPLSSPEPHLLLHLEQLLTDGVELLNAQSAFLILVNTKTGHQYSWALPDENAKSILPAGENLLNSQIPPFALYLRTEGGMQCFSIDQNDRDLHRKALLEAAPLWNPPFQALLIGQLNFGTGWAGQIALGCARTHSNKSGALHLFRHMVRMAERSYRSHSIELAQLTIHERERVARDLHDGVAQTLSATDMQIELLRRGIREYSDNNVDEVLTDVQETLRRKLKMIRVQIEQLRSGLNLSGLEPCLMELVRQFEIDTGIPVQFFCNLDEDKISPSVRLDLIQIIGEALSNVRQHSHAAKVEVRLTGHRHLHLTIQNDGCGFSFAGRVSLAKMQAYRMGPRMICNRVQALGGILFIESSPQAGARLEITLPMIESSFSPYTGWTADPPEAGVFLGSPKVPKGPSSVNRPSPLRRA